MTDSTNCSQPAKSVPPRAKSNAHKMKQCSLDSSKSRRVPGVPARRLFSEERPHTFGTHWEATLSIWHTVTGTMLVRAGAGSLLPVQDGGAPHARRPPDTPHLAQTASARRRQPNVPDPQLVPPYCTRPAAVSDGGRRAGGRALGGDSAWCRALQTPGHRSSGPRLESCHTLLSGASSDSSSCRLMSSARAAAGSGDGEGRGAAAAASCRRSISLASSILADTRTTRQTDRHTD